MAEKVYENKKYPKHEHKCPKCGNAWPCIMPKLQDLGGLCRRESDTDIMCWPCERPLVREKLGMAVFQGGKA